MLILTPRKPVTTVIGVRSESAADIVAKMDERAVWLMGYEANTYTPRGGLDELFKKRRPKNSINLVWKMKS